MQSLNCDLWVMERQALRNFVAMAAIQLNASEEVRVATTATSQKQKSIAVIPIHGALEARPTLFGYMMGMASYEVIGKMVRQYANDESVSHIILDCASPGGMVYGCSECAQIIYEARQKKPILAVINPLAASGGYWLAAAATRVIIQPSSDTGSVGVIAEHVDVSQALANDGQKVTVVRSSASPYKQETNDTEPLSDEAKNNMQARADAIYQRFAGDLARFRGVSTDYVNEKFGKGRVVDSQTALANRMVDRIDTLDGMIQKIIDGRVRINAESVQDVWDAPTFLERRLEKVAALKGIAETV